MIPFDDIDQRLKDLSKDRCWLAEISVRSPHSIRAALAPNAKSKSRSALLQKALSDAIEGEESRQKAPSPAESTGTEEKHEDTVTLIPTAAQYASWSAAQHSSADPTLKAWATSRLDAAAAAWAASQQQPPTKQSQ